MVECHWKNSEWKWQKIHFPFWLISLNLLNEKGSVCLHSPLQVLWEHVQPSQNFSIYNGGVEAVSNLLGRQHYRTAFHVQHGLVKSALVLLPLWRCYSVFSVYLVNEKDLTAFGDWSTAILTCCRCSYSLWYRLYWIEVGAVGRAGLGWFLWSQFSSTLPHDLQQQHMGLLHWLCCFQVPVHAADNNSHVRKLYDNMVCFRQFRPILLHSEWRGKKTCQQNCSP